MIKAAEPIKLTLCVIKANRYGDLVSFGSKEENDSVKVYDNRVDSLHFHLDSSGGITTELMKKTHLPLQKAALSCSCGLRVVIPDWEMSEKELREYFERWDSPQLDTNYKGIR